MSHKLMHLHQSVEVLPLVIQDNLNIMGIVDHACEKKAVSIFL